MLKNNQLRLGLIPVILILTAFFSGCKSNKAAVDKESIPVRVMKVKLSDIQSTLDYVDDIKARDEAQVYPKVSGKILEKLKQEGDSVNKGDAIAYIDRDEVGFKFEKAPVESPLTGVIGRINVDIGTQVSPQTAVALVVNMEKVKIELDIPEVYLPKISIGQSSEITVQAYPERKFTGTVSKISPVLDLATRTAPVEIIIPNSDYILKSGMYAKVKLLIDEHKNIPVIRKESVLGRPPNQYVYIVKADKAVLRNVKLGISQGAYYEVLEGIKEGDLIVEMGQQRLHDGANVIIEQEKQENS